MTRRQLKGSREQTNDPIRERAKQTAIEALKGKLFNISYRYEVLDDPDGSGFLVYALGHGRKSGDVVIHDHFVFVETMGSSSCWLRHVKGHWEIVKERVYIEGS